MLRTSIAWIPAPVQPDEGWIRKIGQRGQAGQDMVNAGCGGVRENLRTDSLVFCLLMLDIKLQALSMLLHDLPVVFNDCVNIPLL